MCWGGILQGADTSASGDKVRSKKYEVMVADAPDCIWRFGHEPL